MDNLITELTKAINKTKEKTTAQIYGTVVKMDDVLYVQLDGSEELTPAVNVVNRNEGDRVTVEIKNHTAIITGNLTANSTTEDNQEKDKLVFCNVIETLLGTKTTELSAKSQGIRMDDRMVDSLGQLVQTAFALMMAAQATTHSLEMTNHVKKTTELTGSGVQFWLIDENDTRTDCGSLSTDIDGNLLLCNAKPVYKRGDKISRFMSGNLYMGSDKAYAFFYLPKPFSEEITSVTIANESSINNIQIVGNGTLTQNRNLKTGQRNICTGYTIELHENCIELVLTGVTVSLTTRNFYHIQGTIEFLFN